MAKKKKNKQDEDFGLVPPTGKMDDATDSSMASEPEEKTKPKRSTAPKKTDAKYKQMGWKGFEPEEVDPDPMLTFGEKSDGEEDDLDMTPMVDVTFLLLIFFMVTASFTLQKSIEQPPTDIEDPSTTVIETPEDEDDYVEVIIDQNNSYYVTSRDEEEVEAPSDREMRSRMRDAKAMSGATRLIIRAHVDSMHRKVVTAWDAGISAGMERIEIRTTDEDF